MTAIPARFPQERSEKRAMLLRAVEDVCDVLAADVAEGEDLRTLPPSSVAALRDSGLYLLKFPEALGGAEADPATQLEVIEAVAYSNPAAAWCLAICADVLGFAGAYLPDAALDEMLSGGRPPMMAGSLVPGTAVPADGGYRLTGSWSWGSGVRHAEWISTQALVNYPDERRPIVLNCFFPAAQARIDDNWRVLGMQGTGSCDFSVSDLFLPENFTYEIATTAPRRGGAIYRLGWPGYVINICAGVALGMGRRALDEILDLARSKKRGYGKKLSLADRSVFQCAVAEGDLRLRAVRALMMQMLENAWTTAAEAGQPGPRLQAEMHATATLAMDTALDVTNDAFRYGGGTAVFSSHPLQRCLRDLYTIASHLLVSDASYEHYGQVLLAQASAGVRPERARSGLVRT